MARLLGEAFVAVSPDTKAFREKATAEIKKALAGVKADLKIDVNGRGLAAKVRLAAEKAAKEAGTVDARVGIDTSAVKKATADILAQQSRIAKARAQDASAEARQRASITKMYADMFSQIDKADKAQAKADASRLKQQQAVKDAQDKAWASYGKNLLASEKLDQARSKSFFSRLGGDSADSFRSSFASKLGDSSGGGGIISVIRSVFGKAGDDGGGEGGDNAAVKFAKSFGRSIVMQSPGITALVVAGFAALPAALGVVAAGAGVALGGGLIAAAMIEISKRQKTVQKQIKALTSKKNLTADDKTALKDLQQQQAMLEKQAAVYQSINNAIIRVKNAFFSFAAATTKPLIKPIADAIERLAALMNGPWTGIFRNLFAASAPLVRPFVDLIDNLVRTLIPALTSTLRAAGGPIGDLVRNLGNIVGLQIGNWFKAAIPYIRDSSKYVEGLLTALGMAGTFIVKFGGSVAKVFMAMAPLFEQLGKSAGFIGTVFFNVLVPAIIKIVGPLSQIVAEILAAGSAFAQALLPVLAPIADGIAVILAGILQFIANNKGLVTAITDIAIAWKILSLAFSLTPFGAIITAIVVVVALIVHFRKQIVEGLIIAWNAVRHATEVAWNAILGFMKKWWPLILGIVTLGVGLVVGLVIQHWHQIAAFTVSVWNGIFAFFKGIWGHIENVFTGAAKSISNWVSNVWNKVMTVTHAVWNGIYGFLKKWWTTIVVVFTGGLAIIFFAIAKYHNQIMHFVESVWDHIFNFFKGIWGHIENVFTGAGKSLINWNNTVWNHIFGVTSSWWNKIFAFFKGIWGHIENVFTGAGKSISNWAVTTWNHVYGVTSDLWNKIFNFFKAIWGHIENVVTGAVKPIISVITGAWNTVKTNTANIWNNITHVFGNAWNTLKNLASGAASWISTKVTGIWNGLASATANIWRRIGQLMSDGMNAGRRGLAAAINFVTSNLLNPLIKGYNTINNIWSGSDVNPIPPVKLAKGGKVPGYSPGSDTVHAMLSPGEYVLTPEATKAIGVKALDRLNKTRPGQKTRSAAGQHLTSGGQILSDAERFNGHRYIWGGPSNPQGGWDCSSFVGYILGHDFHLPLPGGLPWNGGVHGPVAASYANYGSPVAMQSAQPGDILVEKSGGHVGFFASPGRMFSAYGHAFGTLMTGFPAGGYVVRRATGITPGGPVTGLPNAAGGAATVNPAQQKQYDAYVKLLDTDIKNYGPKSAGFGGIGAAIAGAFHAAQKIAKNVASNIAHGGQYTFATGNVASKIKPAVQSKYNAALAAMTAAAGTPGGNPSVSGSFTGGVVSNGQAFAILPGNLLKAAQFFTQHGYTKQAAAGIAGNMAIESGGDPEQREFGHPGNGGLIGFTPLSKSGARITGNVLADFNNQLGATLNYNNSFIGSSAIAALNAKKTAADAALYYETVFEKPLSVGATASLRQAWANQTFAHLATGGVINEKVIGRGQRTGRMYSLGESGRERVMPERAMHRYEQQRGMSQGQADQMIALLDRLTRATQHGNENITSAITGVGKGVHRRY